MELRGRWVSPDLYIKTCTRRNMDSNREPCSLWPLPVHAEEVRVLMEWAAGYAARSGLPPAHLAHPPSPSIVAEKHQFANYF